MSELQVKFRPKQSRQKFSALCTGSSWKGSQGDPKSIGLLCANPEVTGTAAGWGLGSGGIHPNFTTSVGFGSGGGFLRWNILIPSSTQIPKSLGFCWIRCQGCNSVAEWSKLWQGLVQSLFSPGLNIHRTHQVWRAHSGPRAAGAAGMSWHQKELKMRIFLGGGEDSRHISLVRTTMDVEMKEMSWVPFDSLLTVGLLTQGDFPAPSWWGQGLAFGRERCLELVLLEYSCPLQSARL